MHWWIGDWLNYGERTYGQKYQEVLQPPGDPPDQPRLVADPSRLAEQLGVLGLKGAGGHLLEGGDFMVDIATLVGGDFLVDKAPRWIFQ